MQGRVGGWRASPGGNKPEAPCARERAQRPRIGMCTHREPIHMRGQGQGHVQIPIRIRGREKSAARDPQKSHSGTSPTCATSSQGFECAAVICYRSQPRTGEPFRPHTRECQGTLGAECGNRQGHARLHHLSRPLLSWPPRPLVSKGSPQPAARRRFCCFSPRSRAPVQQGIFNTEKCVLNFGIWAFPGPPRGKRQDFIFYHFLSKLGVVGVGDVDSITGVGGESISPGGCAFASLRGRGAQQVRWVSSPPPCLQPNLLSPSSWRGGNTSLLRPLWPVPLIMFHSSQKSLRSIAWAQSTPSYQSLRTR